MKEQKDIFIHEDGSATMKIVAKATEEWSDIITKKFGSSTIEFTEHRREVNGVHVCIDYSGIELGL